MMNRIMEPIKKQLLPIAWMLAQTCFCNDDTDFIQLSDRNFKGAIL